MGTTSSTADFAQGVKNIRNKPVPLDDHATWKLIFTSTVRLPEVHAMFDTRSIRLLRMYTPESLAILIYKCIDQIVLFTAAKGGNTSDATAVRSALQILTRLLPFAFEDLVVVKYETPVNGQKPINSDPDMRPSVYAKDFANHVFFEGKTCSASGARFPPLEQGLTLAQSLTNGLLALTAVPGFTIGARQVVSVPAPPGMPLVEPGKLWCGGIGSSGAAVIHYDTHIVDNRLCLLRCMMSALVTQAYRDAVLTRDWVRAAFVNPASPNGATFALSLLNTVASYSPESGIPYAAHLVTNYEDLVLKAAQVLAILFDDADFYPADQLTKIVIATNFGSATAPNAPPPPPPPAQQPPTVRHSDPAVEPVRDEPEEAQPAGAPGGNVRSMLAAITRNLEVEVVPDTTPDDERANEPTNDAPPSEPLVELEAVAERSVERHHAYWETVTAFQPKDAHQFLIGLVRLASNSVTARNVYLPASKRSLGSVEFFMILMSKLLQKSDSIRAAFLSDRAMVRSFMVPLLDFGVAGAQDPHRSPQLRCAIHMLAQLSGHREFTVALNHSFNEWIPYPLDPFTGTYADLVLVTLHTIFVNRTEWVKTHQLHVAAIMSNMAPFCTTLSTTTSTKFVGLLDSMANAAWIQVNTSLHSRLLQCLVCTIASLLQYQFKGSNNLMYALLRSPKTVKKLVELSHDTTVGLPEGFHKSEHVFTISRAVEAATHELDAAFAADPNLDTFNFLANLTLVGELPAPHRLELLHFPPTPMHDAFIASWAWSIIYVFSYPQFIDTEAVKSFHVKRSLTPPLPTLPAA